MPTTIHAVIRATDFLFTSRFMSQDAHRYYLAGVCVHAAANGDLMLAATDGHRLGVMRLSREGGDAPYAPAMDAGSNQGGFILKASKELLSAAKGKPWSKSADRYIRVTDSAVEMVDAFNIMDAADLATAPALTLPLAACMIDGTFPDYVRVLPAACTGLTYESLKGRDGAETGRQYYGFNPAYIAGFEKPDGTKGQTSPVYIQWNGGGPALVTNGDPRFLGVLMPYKVDSGDVIAQRAAVIDGPAALDNVK